MNVTTPSVREVLLRAASAAEHRSGDVVLKLAELEQEIGWAEVMPGLCAEHQAVANRLAELHLLIDHLAANLRGGHGVPPTPDAPVPRKGMRPVTHTKARPVDVPRPAEIRTPANGHTNQVNAQGNRADGLLTRDEATRLIGYSVPGFHRARSAGRIPDPHAYQGKSPLWLREQLAGIKPLRPGRRSKT